LPFSVEPEERASAGPVRHPKAPCGGAFLMA
jgi:hypothetical protein